ncbi:MAG: CcmD family protein [Bacteroidetes bacterium]|nr:CcmD family protein [Bacteroidota bacterium]MBP6400927.1 CcmD family protein [Bacteroidia bacterium]MBK9524828.1 CcmD family protein [Bacteroidota bacterium]MBK9542994.1 CcmD family protein [Bacteroidota bacterium]MBL0257273.1 CcmD family protein [Bacteroidota bacterium]
MFTNSNPTKIILTFCFLICSVFSFGQSSDVEMADLMHQNGKIYVVIAVLAVILGGFIINLILVDRRLRKLEKRSGK